MKTLFSQKKISLIIKILVLLADASLIIRIGIVKPYTLQPFEFFIIIASFLLFLACCVYGIENDLRLILKKYGKIFGLINLLLLIGLANAWLIYGITAFDVLNLTKQYFYFFTVYFGFILHLYYCGKDKNFGKKAVYLMSLSVLFTPLLFFPTLAKNLHLVGDIGSFIGLSGNQSVAAFYLLIPLALFLQKTFSEKKIINKIIYWFITILVYSLLLWTGSRGSWLASIALFSCFILLYTSNIKPLIVRSKKVFILGLMVIISVVISFTLLSHNTKVMVLDRLVPITNYHPNLQTLEATIITFKSVIGFIQKEYTDENPTASKPRSLFIPSYQNRQDLWPQAIKTMINHPAGLGLEYSRMSKEILQHGEYPTLAHNTFLETWLSGGIALFVLIIMAVFYISKKLYSMPEDNDKIMLCGLWISFLIVLFFNDYLFTPWVWIITGIILGKIGEEKKVLV